jgi:signal transduction histidine kinase
VSAEAASTLEQLAAPVSLAVDVLLMREEERRMAEQLRQTEKLAALGELVAGVAHEINNPLTGVSAFAQLLLEEPLGEEQAESVRLIKREADRAIGVIRDLLVFARKTGPRRVPTDVNALLEHTARLRSYGLRSHGIELACDLDPALPPVVGDDQKLQQVFLNLLVNAEYAMQGSAVRRLTIRSRRDGERACVAIGDTGSGMPPDVQSRVFEPFFTTKPAGVGTGLGLSVSYGIVQSHGGTIAVRSVPGAGTTFEISLPLAPPDVHAAAPSAASPRALPPSPPSHA